MYRGPGVPLDPLRGRDVRPLKTQSDPRRDALGLVVGLSAALVLLAPTVPMRWIALVVGREGEAEVFSTGTEHSLRGRATQVVTVRFRDGEATHERSYPVDAELSARLERELNSSSGITVRADDPALAAALSARLDPMLHPHLTVAFVPGHPLLSGLVDDGGYARTTVMIFLGVGLGLVALYAVLHRVVRRREAAALSADAPGKRRGRPRPR